MDATLRKGFLLLTATVVGSYPKLPAQAGAPNLRTALARLERGQITAEEFQRTEDLVTEVVIKEQVQAGVGLISDGQIRWEDGQTYFARRIGGFSINGLIRYFNNNTYFRQPAVTGKLGWQGPIGVRDFLFAKERSPVPVKAVITGPYTLARLSQDQAYHNLRTLVLDLAEVLNQEAIALQRSGATFIQFDEPAILKWKGDFALFEEACRRLTRGLTAKTALYLYFWDIGELYPDLFHLPFQAYGLDFVSGEANYQIVKEFPSDKELGLGILDGRNTRLEPVEELVEGVRRMSSVVSLDRMYVSPSCGLEFLPRDRANQKLVRLVEGVKKAREALS
ncbi:MAG: methylcobamide--CoM methyltransferase [Chloroflexi bacterium]|nr:methylcobamide--CoM methyltransferase [Chloroflexota bacterium]